MNASAKVCLGHVMHRRLRPVVNAFVYPVFYAQLPLRHLDSAVCSIFSIDKPNLLSLHSKDHGARDGSPLLPWIEQLLAAHGLPNDGEIILQAFPRVLGFVFNPVSFWYCHDREDRLIAVLAEVNNTFGGRHHYLLHHDGKILADGEELRAEKNFHVSPFNKVEGSYRFRFVLEHAVQQAHIDYDDAEGELLLTAISGRPRPWSAASLLANLLRMPFLTLGVVIRIHWQAFKLWRSGLHFYGAQPSQSPLKEPGK